MGITISLPSFHSGGGQRRSARHLGRDKMGTKRESREAKRNRKRKANQSKQRVEAKGDETFLAGNFEEAAKHYTLAIGHDVNDHVLYSNRSACLSSLHFHIGLQDQTSEEVVEYLAMAVSMQEVQLCYERLLELSVEAYAKEESERAKLKSKARARQHATDPE